MYKTRSYIIKIDFWKNSLWLKKSLKKLNAAEEILSWSIFRNVFKQMTFNYVDSLFNDL